MGRPLTAAEADFLTRYFGDGLRLDSIRVGSSIGRRCWSPYGQRISLTRACFHTHEPRSEVLLSDPWVAATFAHEAMHVWQRQHRVWVTLRGALLQTGYVLRVSDPYCYAPSDDPEAMLAQFDAGNIEQQGKIFEDYVYAHRLGRDISRFEQVVRRVRDSD